jgi:hypothetical protein
MNLQLHIGWNFFAFKTLRETTLHRGGERRVKVKELRALITFPDGLCFPNPLRIKGQAFFSQMCTISGIILSLVTLSKATEGLAKNKGEGFVGLPGFMNKMPFSHFMFELCV